MASLLDGLIFDGLYGSRILSLLLCTLDISGAIFKLSALPSTSISPRAVDD